MLKDLKRRTKIVTSSEMARIEAIAIKENGKDKGKQYMEEVGAILCAKISEEVEKNARILLLCGKGNNGGDAYVAGELLLKKGNRVVALQLGERTECSTLSQKMSKKFEQSQGIIQKKATPKLFENCDLILDGLLGTGFKGLAYQEFQEIINLANNSGKPIFAIDIPSGLSQESLTKKT